MRKLLIMAGVAAVSTSVAANAAKYDVHIEDEMRFNINGVPCNISSGEGEATPLLVNLDVTSVENESEEVWRELDMTLLNVEWSSLECAGFDEPVVGGGPDQHPLTISVNGNGSVSPGGDAQEIWVNIGQYMDFDVNPESGYMLDDDVGGSCNSQPGGNRDYSVGPMVENGCDVIFNFVEVPPTEYTISASATGGGSISPAGEVTAYEGQVKEFTLSPDEGEELEGVDSNCGGSTADGQYVTGSIGANCSITANFTSPAPEVPDGVDMSACGGEWPSGIVQEDTIDLAGSHPQYTMNIGTGVISTPFKTLDSASTRGRFTFTASLGTNTYTKKVWISRCPNETYEQSGCRTRGVESPTLYWATYDQRGHCELDPNAQYFLNVTSPNCPNSSGCGTYRNIMYRD